MRSTIPVLTLLILLLPPAAPADECRDCHRAIDFNESNPRLFFYYDDFANSVHGVARLACTDCHGGDANTRDLDQAHLGVMDPVRFDTVTATCGRCHAAEHQGFTASTHYRLLTRYRNAPNCVTCHGAMDVEVVNPGKIQATCAFCHNPESFTSPDVPERAEAILSRMASIHHLKTGLEARAAAGSRIWDLAQDYVTLSGRWHTFDFEAMDTETRRLKAEYRTAEKMLEEDPEY